MGYCTQSLFPVKDEIAAFMVEDLWKNRSN